METRLESYIKEYPCLIKVNKLARQEYAKAGKLVHNYNHAIWVTEKAIEIYENEKPTEINPNILITSALMHDTGVSIEPYEDHTINSSKIIKEKFHSLGFTSKEIDKIALAVEEHNGLIHTFPESQYLYDADTLNKAGAHGIQQYFLIGHEFSLSIPEIAKRAISTLPKKIEKSYYTKTAKEIDKGLGNDQYCGLELTLKFWETFNNLLKEGNMKEYEIINKVYKILGIGALK